MKITVDELLTLGSSINLIDIRDENNYLKGHIPGAKNITSLELLYHPDKYLNFNQTYYFYCDVGYLSEDLCMRLKMMGYHVVSVVGGYHNYLFKR